MNRSTKKRIVLFAVPASVLVAVVLFVFWRSSIPRYGGKTVDAWLRELAPGRMAVSSSKSWKDAREAFGAMGPEAMPYVVDWMRESPLDSALALRVYDLAGKAGLKRFLPPIVPQSARIHTSMRLLEELGPKAIAAREDLEELMIHNELPPGGLDDNYRCDILQIIGAMGILASNSAPVVAREFHSTNEWIVNLAVDVFNAITPPGDTNATALEQAIRDGRVRAGKGLPVLAKLGGKYEEFVPLLEKQLCGTNQHAEAVLAVRQLGLQKELFVPHARTITQQQPRYLQAFLKELARLGPAARPAAEVVKEQLSHEAEDVREEAAKALIAIAPEMIARAVGDGEEGEE